MLYECHHLDRFGFANLDYIDEIQESEKKAVILIAGASSSGKSFAASYLNQLLEKYEHNSLIISLDSYNIGLSGIIPNKVNANFFDGTLNNMDEIKKRIKNIIYDVNFDNKFSDEVLLKIKEELKDIIPPTDMNKFLYGLKIEWSKVNFDEPTVYDMKEAFEDIKILINDGDISEKKYSKVFSERVPNDIVHHGKDYDIIIVEGIYALDDSFLDFFKDSNIPLITNFIDGNAKTLFLRRIIRDKQTTSADNVFTIQLYFKYILKAYYETILPSRANADIVLNNDMNFTELTNGELYLTKDEVFTDDATIYEDIKKESIIKEISYQKDIYFITKNENERLVMNNILRLRSISNDNGNNYTLSSLIHKGKIKLRKDDKIIRPINILLSEDEIKKVWNSEEQCIKDFYYAGFMIGKIVKKVKTRLVYKNQDLTLKQFVGPGSYIEFNKPYVSSVITSIKNRVTDSKTNLIK